jgi:integrase
LAQSREQFAGRTWTVAQWLRYWLTTRKSIRPTTLHIYARHVEKDLIPTIGHLRLAEVTGRHLTAMFAELANSPDTGLPRTASTMQRIRATLRAAYNAAIREGLVTDNPARRVEMPQPRRPHAVVWTDGRVESWQSDGVRPAVAVWTTAQTAAFLDYVRGDPLYALWWLVCLRGLRRGEAAGLRWQDLDLERRQLTIVSQRTTVGYQIVEGPRKSAARRRTIALDDRTVAVLRAHRQRQHALYQQLGRHWIEAGYVFVTGEGRPYHPNYFTKRLQYLIKQAGLPPVRLHDLRHGAASLAHTAGADLKTVQDQLGHASIVLTADTYTTVLPAAQHTAADATARLILTAARGLRAKINRANRRPAGHRPSRRSAPTTPGNPVPTGKTAGQSSRKRKRKTRK